METCLPLKYCLIILLLTWKVNSQNDGFSVGTASGKVKGTLINFNGHDVLQYLGIPYARPPLGDLRFKKTQPVDPWKGTLLADQWPPACVQYLKNPFPGVDTQDGKSEDCLYLNIWIPQSALNATNRKVPVMFWIHGGGFFSGSNRVPVYNGQALAAVGGIVVVTINYRLGTFGFFTTGTGSAPGNVAMYDILEALKWVNMNIDAFGGDPNQVTIAGQSAGSWAVGLLCVSPLSTGLFQRAILQSGSPAYLNGDNNTANIMNSQKIAEALGCADDINSIYLNPEAVLRCMKGVSAIQIAKTEDSIIPLALRSLYPSFGDEFLPVNARLAIISGQFHNVDVLIGNTRNEGTLITIVNSYVFGRKGEKNPQVNKTFGEMSLRSNLSGLPLAEAIVQHYLGDVAENDSATVLQQMSDALGDLALLCPAVYFAEKYSQAGNNVYFYLFVHRPSTTPWAEWMGVAHYQDVQFVFGVPLQSPGNYTDEEIFLSNRVIRVWSNFVKKGIPSKLSWPLYSRENPTYVTMGTELQPRYGEGPHKNNCDFLRTYFGFV